MNANTLAFLAAVGGVSFFAVSLLVGVIAFILAKLLERKKFPF